MFGFAVVLDGLIFLWLFVRWPFGSYLQRIARYIERDTQWDMTLMITSFFRDAVKACVP